MGKQIVLGTAQLVDPYGVMGQSVESSGDDTTSFLQLATRFGFTALDTAPAYPGAEDTIGSAHCQLQVHTKFDPALPPEESIRLSLERLRRRRVEVAYFHDPDAASRDGGSEIDEAAVLVGGVVVSLGASVYSVEACRAALAHHYIDVVQIPVNPLKRDVLQAVSDAGREGARVFGRSLFGQGLLVSNVDQLPRQVSHLAPAILAFQTACRELRRSPLEVCLLWARDHPHLDGVIVGAASVEQLREVGTALRLPPLDVAERSLIDALELPDPRLFDPRTW